MEGYVYTLLMRLQIRKVCKLNYVLLLVEFIWHLPTIKPVRLLLTRYPVNRPQRAQHPDRSDRRQIQVLHVQAILKRSGDHNEKVQSIPRVRQIRVLAPHAHRHHFDGHLQREKGENDVVEELRQGGARMASCSCVRCSLVLSNSHSTRHIDFRLAQLTCNTLHLFVTQASSTHG